MELSTRLNRGQAIGASLQKIWKVTAYQFQQRYDWWPVAMYGCESWTLRKNEETRLDAFEMKGLRKILQVSWIAKKTNEWVLNKAGVKRELLDTVKARKLAYYGHTVRKQGSCLEKEIMQGTMPGARSRGRPHTAWMDNIKMWKSQSEWHRTEINGESTSVEWPTLSSRVLCLLYKNVVSSVEAWMGIEGQITCIEKCTFSVCRSSKCTEILAAGALPRPHWQRSLRPRSWV